MWESCVCVWQCCAFNNALCVEVVWAHVTMLHVTNLWVWACESVCVCVWNVWVDVKLPLNVLTLHFQFSRFPFYMQGNWALCDWPSSTKLVAAFSSNQFCISGDRLSQEPDCWRDFSTTLRGFPKSVYWDISSRFWSWPFIDGILFWGLFEPVSEIDFGCPSRLIGKKQFLHIRLPHRGDLL